MGPKKKLTRAERNRIEMERLEQARVQAEMETQRAIEEERKRLELERKLAMEKEKKETAEQALRIEQLTNSNLLIKSMLDHNWTVDREEKEDFERSQYMKRDGLPDPTQPSQMTTYLHLWRESSAQVTVEEARRRTAEIIALLQILEVFIDDPLDAPANLISNWKWIRTQCREQQDESLNAMTYHLLRDVNNRLDRPDIPTAIYNILDEHFILCLWLLVKLATPLHNPRAPPRKRLEINFPETRLNILFPAVLDPKGIVIRVIYVRYDHLSDNCASYGKPAMTDELNRDLHAATSREWWIKMKYKWDNRRPGSTPVESAGAEGESPRFEDGEVPPAVPYRKLTPTASQYAIEFEEIEASRQRQNFETSKLSTSKMADVENTGKKLTRAGSSRVRMSKVRVEITDDPQQQASATIVTVPIPSKEDATGIGDETQGGAGDATQQQTTNDESPAETTEKKKKKKKQYAHLLTDDPIKFKNVSFENALTADEKAAKKATKKAKKKGKGGAKTEGEQGVVTDAPSSTTELQEVTKVEETPAEVTIKKEEGGGASKDKKGKKKGGKKAKEPGAESEGETSSEESETKGKKKGKKTGDEAKTPKKPGGKKKQKGEAKSTEESADEEGKEENGEKKKKKKKQQHKRPKVTDSATGSNGAETSSADSLETARQKRIRKRTKKSVSWIGPADRKFMGKSMSGMVDRSSGSIVKSRSDFFESRTSYMDSTVSMRSYGSRDESTISGAASSSIVIKRSRSKSKSKVKKRKTKESKSWLIFDTSSDEYDEDEDLGKKRKKKKGKEKLKKGEPSKESVGEKPEKGKKGKKEKKEKEEKKVEVKEKEPAKEGEKKEKGKGKGKGKKKKGKKEAEEAPAPVDEVDDIMAKIQLMKAAQTVGPVEEPVKEEQVPKKKGKKGKKKKKKKTSDEEGPPVRVRRMSQAEQIRQEMERAEQARIQAELDVKRAEEEERRRQEEERRLGREKEKRETGEQQLRIEQLTHSLNLVKNMLEANWNTNTQEKIDFEWEQYLKCDGLPDPTKPAEMNTYLHLWDQVLNDVSVEEVKHRTNEIIEVLQDFMDDPFDASDSLKADWKWVRGLCRKHQQENLDMATYRLLRDIDSRLNRIDIPTAEYHIDEENFNLSLWLYVQLATPMYNPRAPIRKRLEIDFPKMGVNVAFPSELDAKCMAIRTTYVKYDHLSDTCATYDRPPIPADIDKDLYESTAREWLRKMRFKWDRRKPPPKKTIEDSEGNVIEVEEPEPEIAKDELPPAVPWQKLEPTASTVVIDNETDLYERIRRKLCIDVPDNVINLRKFLIIGGIYCINLFYQPPQPHDQVAFDIRITALQIPKRLCEVPFYIPYQPPTSDSDSDVKKPPEELEEDIKKQESELDKLMMVTLTLPDHVMFLDLPTVCHWDKKRKLWTTEDVHDLKHIEEKNYMTFRTGRFGRFALAVNRYINFPFQAWELKPEPDGSVTFQLTCAILMVEFHIKDNRICLTQLQNSPNNALQDIVGTYFKLPKLIRILQTGGVDLFPACDAFCYVEGACEKHWPMERHLYYNMALLSPSYNFAWSRWNSPAGRRSIVLQMREYKLNSTKQKNHSMLLVTPLKTTFIETTEMNPIFNDTPTEGMKFYSDLYNLMKGTSTMATRNKIQNGSPDVAKTLSDLLIAIRVASFS